ncbi:MAG: polysaccharide biosynthesis tyrosine autokinase [Sphingomonas bacterium]
MNNLPVGVSQWSAREITEADRDASMRLEAFLEEHQSESPLSQYLQILFRRRWIVLAFVLAGVLTALYLTLNVTPLYRATTKLEIAREAAKVVKVDGVEPDESSRNLEFYQTQYGLLKARSLAELVVRKLRLSENDTFMYGYARSKPPKMTASERALRRARFERSAAGILLNHLTVAPVRNSSLVDVSFDSPDPTLSANVVNAIAENYISSNLARRFNSSAYARKFLEDQLARTRAQLEQSEREVVGYATRERIINLDGAPASGASAGGATTPTTSASSPGQSLVGADLTSLNSALSTAKAERIAAQARYDQARNAGGTSSQTLADPATTQLRNSRAALVVEYSKMATQFKADYPQMQALKRQIDEITRQLSQQNTGVVSSLRSDYQAAVQREAALQSQVNGLKEGVLDLRRRSIQYNIFQRDADTNRVLYDGLLQRYKEVGIAGGVGTNNVSVVDPALAPGGPFTPRTTMNLLLGLIAGTLVGAALAFLLEQLDESILAPHDLEKKLGIPLLGSVPKVPDADNPLVELEDPKSPLAEAYLSVQTSLRFATSTGAPRVLLLTSSRESEGKSTTAIAIARNFAALGRSVILIDADMRDPSTHKLLGLSNAFGLSHALSGTEDLRQLVQPGPHDLMLVMTAGPIPPNPAELLAGPNLARTLEALLQQVDHIVIDGPPVLGLADAPLMASVAEATVFVIAANDTRTKTARVSLRRLADVRAHIIGAVLTKFNAKSLGYEYAYNYTYSYGDRTSKSVIRKTLRGILPSRTAKD